MSVGTAILSSKSRSLQQNEDGNLTYSCSYYVKATATSDGPLDALAATGIPAMWAEYSLGSPLRVSARSVSIEEDLIFKVDITYSTRNPEANPDPTDNTPKVSVAFAKYDKPLRQDVNDVAIVNSAGDPLGDVVVDRSVASINVQRNEATFDFDLAYSLQDVINDDVWNGFAAETVKLSSFSADRQSTFVDGDLFYFWVVAYQFDMAPRGETWKVKVLDEGLNELDGGTPEKKQPIKIKGEKVSSPVLLDGAGHQLASTETEGILLEFDGYEAVDFSVFAITL